MTNAPVIEVHDLVKTFNGTTAVDRLGFTAARGEILGLLGPNGAGKTTAIQMLLGIIEPTSGTIRILGKDIARHRIAILSRINFSSAYVSLPQNPFLVILAFLVSALSFTSLGLLLGAVLPTSRAAQGVGLVLFFVMLILGGAGPPPEAMTHLMRVVGDFTPMQHAVTLLQNAWQGLGWNWMEFGILAGILFVSLIAATLVIRRNS